MPTPGRNRSQDNIDDGPPAPPHAPIAPEVPEVPDAERGRPSSARARKREQEIYEVAAELFHRKGYAATTLQDIAEAAGMLKGSLYYYIDSKEDLLFRITTSIHEDATANLERARAMEGTAEQKLRALLEGHVLSFGRRLTWIRVFYTEYPALSGDRRSLIMAERHRYERFVDDLIRAGQEDGSFCPDLHLRIVANAALTLVNTVYLWYRPGRDEPIETVASTYADFVIRGLRCDLHHAHPSR